MKGNDMKKIAVLLAVATLGFLPVAVLADTGSSRADPVTEGSDSADRYTHTIATLLDAACGTPRSIQMEADSFYLADHPTSVWSANSGCGLSWFECTGDACHPLDAAEAARKYGVGEP